MRRKLRVKWRPPLMLVLGGSLLAVLVLPVFGLVVVDVLAPGLSAGSALLTVAVGAFGATLVLGWLLWRLILRPVQGLAQRAEVIRGGGVAEPMEHYGTPEIGDLGQAVLDMAEVLQARELAVRSYADHVTHELKTPLTAIRGAAELLASEENMSAEARGLVSTISQAEARLERLLAAAREIAAARTPMHHGETLLRAVPLPEAEIIVDVTGGDVAFPLSRTGLGIVLTHLVNNAVASGAGRVWIEGRAFSEGAVLTVSDNGPGISTGNRDKCLEPFFTTRRDAGGTGMGLAIVQSLLLAHGGEITLEPSDAGARFRIVF